MTWNASSIARTVAGLVTLAAGAAFVDGCAPDEVPAESRSGAELRSLERSIVGTAADYPADLSLHARTTELAASQRARRQVAWDAVARTLSPVRIGGANGPSTLPRFRTWYGKDDVARIFARSLASLTPAERAARAPLPPGTIRAAMANDAASRGAFSAADVAARTGALGDAHAREGLGGNGRVAYSPAFVTHAIGNYRRLLDPREIAGDEPPVGDNFALALDAEFPASAALIKASWQRVSFGDARLPMEVHDTDARTLETKLASEDGGWGAGARNVDPPDDAIYTVTMADGTKFRMPALHIVTKELRDWLWITLWWSDTPDDDFGADRPASVARLGAPFDHYKMSVVVAFEEQDPDPTGGFRGSLGDALAVANRASAGRTWASNPYIERGAHNAQTNCIGCHQHAGTNESSASILGAPARFPAQGRTKTRRNFPTDYVWALTSPPERLGEIFEEQLGSAR